MQRHFIWAVAMITLLASLASDSSANAQSASPPKEVSAEQVRLSQKQAELKAKQWAMIDSIDLLKSEISALEKNRQTLLKQQDEIGLSAESFPEIVKMLQVQRIELTIEIAGLDARRDALLQAQAQSGTDRRAQQDAVPLLEQLLAVEKEELSRRKKLVEKGIAPLVDLNEPKRKILEVEIKIAEAKATSNASPEASQLRADLLDTSLERAERNARLESTTRLLEKMIASRKGLREFNDVQDRLVRKNDQLRQTSVELEMVKLELSAAEALLKSMNDEK